MTYGISYQQIHFQNTPVKRKLCKEICSDLSQTQQRLHNIQSPVFPWMLDCEFSENKCSLFIGLVYTRFRMSTLISDISEDLDGPEMEHNSVLSTHQTRRYQSLRVWSGSWSWEHKGVHGIIWQPNISCFRPSVSFLTPDKYYLFSLERHRKPNWVPIRENSGN